VDIPSLVKSIVMEIEDKASAGIVVADRLVLNMPDGAKVVSMRGEKLEAPHWMLRILDSKGLVKQEEPDLTINDILRIHHDETHKKSSRELSLLPENFYFRVRRYLAGLEKKIDERPSPELIQEHSKSLALLSEIVERRLSTILHVAISGRGEESILGRMSPEEEALYRQIRSIIDSWRETVIGKRASR